MNKTKYVRPYRVTKFQPEMGYDFWQRADTRNALLQHMCSRHYGFGRPFWITLSLCYCHLLLAGDFNQSHITAGQWWRAIWFSLPRNWSGAHG